MATFLLIRHATTAETGKRLGGHTQASLDERGQEQARALAARLGEVPLTAVYSSPLPRALETAEPLAAPRGLPVRAADGVIEVDYGQWTNRPLKQVARTNAWKTVQQRPSAVAFPGGETLRGAQERAVGTLETLAGAHRRDAVLAVVSHADVIKALVAFYLGQPLDLFQRVRVDPASVTLLRVRGGDQPALERLNDTGPLTAAQLGRRRGRARRPRRGEGSRRG